MLGSICEDSVRRVHTEWLVCGWHLSDHGKVTVYFFFPLRMITGET